MYVSTILYVHTDTDHTFAWRCHETPFHLVMASFHLIKCLFAKSSTSSDLIEISRICTLYHRYFSGDIMITEVKFVISDRVSVELKNHDNIKSNKKKMA